MPAKKSTAKDKKPTPEEIEAARKKAEADQRKAAAKAEADRRAIASAQNDCAREQRIRKLARRNPDVQWLVDQLNAATATKKPANKS